MRLGIPDQATNTKQRTRKDKYSWEWGGKKPALTTSGRAENERDSLAVMLQANAMVAGVKVATGQ